MTQAMRKTPLRSIPPGNPFLIRSMSVRLVPLLATVTCALCLGDIARCADEAPGNHQHWAYLPIRALDLPTVHDKAWSRNTIDHFVLARLEAHDLRPAPDADPEVLVRRVTYALTGLPPTPEEIDNFTTDPSQIAYRQLVDRLLESPRFGERWGRHWLDVVRFGESNTLRGTVFGQAWRYRDYVIDALNSDLPFNRFVIEQVAGDLLPADSWQERRRQMTATTMLALGNTNFENQDKDQLRMDVVDEQLEVMGRAFLAQTISCARCHDHKFDPIPTRDYYALAGIFRNTKTLEHGNVSRWLDLPLPSDPATESRISAHTQQVDQLQQRMEAVNKLLAAADQAQPANRPESSPIEPVADATAAEAPEGNGEQDDSAALRVELEALATELKELQDSAPPRDLVMTVAEENEISNTRIHIRGSAHDLGAEVPRGVLQVAHVGPQIDFTDHESGRRQLGEWLASDSNPLTARVIVNRLWHWLYGVGLVRTTDNFGVVGELPSHPELLDHLALRFQRDDWSVKSMIRQMMVSRTYQMSSDASPAAVDEENRLLWRMNRHRLEAECIRDTMLMVSGQLQLEMHGPTFAADCKEDYDFHYDGLRRSVYAPVFRNALLEVFEVFDFADPSIVVGRRSVSTVPTQALFMMNNPFVVAQSRRAAERLWHELPAADDEQRIERAYRLTLGRRPSAAELQLSLDFVGRADESTRRDVWGELYQALFATLDFRFVN